MYEEEIIQNIFDLDSKITDNQIPDLTVQQILELATKEEDEALRNQFFSFTDHPEQVIRSHSSQFPVDPLFLAKVEQAFEKDDCDFEDSDVYLLLIGIFHNLVLNDPLIVRILEAFPIDLTGDGGDVIRLKEKFMKE